MGQDLQVCCQTNNSHTDNMREMKLIFTRDQPDGRCVLQRAHPVRGVLRKGIERASACWAQYGKPSGQREQLARKSLELGKRNPSTEADSPHATYVTLHTIETVCPVREATEKRSVFCEERRWAPPLSNSIRDGTLYCGGTRTPNGAATAHTFPCTQARQFVPCAKSQRSGACSVRKGRRARLLSQT